MRKKGKVYRVQECQTEAKDSQEVGVLICQRTRKRKTCINNKDKEKEKEIVSRLFE